MTRREYKAIGVHWSCMNESQREYVRGDEFWPLFNARAEWRRVSIKYGHWKGRSVDSVYRQFTTWIRDCLASA